MGIFQARGRRLVQQRDDVETRGYEGVQRQQPLGAGGVGRHADRGLHGFTRRKAGVRAILQVAFQLSQKAGEKFGQSVAAAGQVHFGPRPGGIEQTFERSQHRPPGLAADGGSVHTEAQLPGGVGGDKRGPRIHAVERDDGVVASVDGRNDCVGGAKVDTDSHPAQF